MHSNTPSPTNSRRSLDFVYSGRQSGGFSTTVLMVVVLPALNVAVRLMFAPVGHNWSIV